MASGTTKIADVIVPEIFTPYTQQLTEEKSALIQSGAVVRDAAMDNLMAGGGLTFNTPSFKDLDNDDDLVSSDDAGDSTPNKIGTAQEIAVRLSRNNSWSTADLVSDLAGVDPQSAIGNRVAEYWTRRLQRIYVATMQGLFADNDAAPTGGDTHTQYDLTNDISGGGYVAGVTDFSAEAFIDTQVTMGDAAGDLGTIMVHSIVFARMKKNNLIDFIPDATGQVSIPTFLGLRVIIDDGMPNPAGAGAAATAAGIYHSWLLGPATVRMGVSDAKVPTEVLREPKANNGAGKETLFTRKAWSLHPAGHAFIGSLTGAPGGPSNAATANNLAHAASWRRVFPERKQIKIARLITRES